MKTTSRLFLLCLLVGVFNCATGTRVCSKDNDCPDPYTECVQNVCECKKNYVKQGDRCYGLNNALCSQSSDCVSNRLLCKSGKCKLVPETKVGDYFCSWKSDALVCWGPNKPEKHCNAICRTYGFQKAFTVPGVEIPTSDNKLTCRYIWNEKSYVTTNAQYLEDNEKMKWKSSGFTMDKVVYGGSDESGSSLILLCKVKYGSIEYYGRLSPPTFDTCMYFVNEILHEACKFDTLVYEA